MHKLEMCRVCTLNVVVMVILAARSIPAADWPQWGGRAPGRNMVSSETGLPDSFKPGEKSTTGPGILPETSENVRWGVKLGSFIYGNPTVIGGRVFVGTDDSILEDGGRIPKTKSGMIQCLDEATGKVLWRITTPKRSKDRLPAGALYSQQHCGTCSSPAVAGNRVYVITTACEIICLDVNGQADGNDGPFKDEGRYMAGPGKPPVEVTADDGDIIWICDLIDQLGVCPHDVASCSILVDGPFLYTTTSNGVDSPHEKCLRPDAPGFVVFEASTGRLLAKDIEDLGHEMWHCLWSPPAMGIVNGKKLVFFGGGDGFCYAFEALTEVPEKTIDLKKIWQYDCNPPHYRLRDGKPIPYYEGDKRKKYSTNKNDGTYLGPSQIISTPVFHEGRVYVTIGQDPEHGRGRGLLHCIDASKTGDVIKAGCVWMYDAIERSIGSVAITDDLLYAADLAGRIHCLDVKTGKPVWVHELKAETWSTPLVADGKIFIGTKKAFMILSAGKETKELAQISLGAPAYGTPVAANGTLFVSSQKYLWAVQKGAKLVSIDSGADKN
ncbi:MAG: hypothetical protein A2283_20795 [Lentisphaerae bacterium RIFOXYA12_FULL_48_11]|nr:MAG: hypothetical protein A2283_20795 [Lentisphaerae bacterium RIFOXYA12_FULL_48_11]